MNLTIKLDQQTVIEAQRELVASAKTTSDFEAFLARVADAAKQAADAQLPGELVREASLTCLPVALLQGGAAQAWVESLGEDAFTVATEIAAK